MLLAVLLAASAVTQDSIRSALKTVDIASGTVETVFTEQRHFEAPNWSRDGRFFLINSKGRLYKLDARNPKELRPINTGFATRANNDHGISPDGKSLVISHEVTEDWQTSTVFHLPINGSKTPRQITTKSPSFWHGWSPDGKTLAFVGRRDDEFDIYTIPLAGGIPRQVTTKAPSFWHGWSPDGTTLAFVGRRDGEFDIYTIPVTGGAEKRITTCKGLDDGPDYSPDGAFIYYNSFCSGRMQIWRMRPDGSGAEQLTSDAYANWFPHPSPDGRWVVFMAFLEDQGQDHPFGRQVKLRLMDVRDRSVRDLTPPFFGGQGTINVPSWSPDSRKVAFVSFERHVRTP